MNKVRTVDLTWCDHYQDYVIPRENSYEGATDLMLCGSIARDIFGIREDAPKIRVSISNSYFSCKENHVLSPGRDGMWYLRTSNSFHYYRHYIYSRAGVFLEEILKEWFEAQLFIVIEELKDDE